MTATIALHDVRRQAGWIVGGWIAVSAVLYAHLGARPVLPALIFLAGVGSVLAAVDVTAKRLPDVLVLPSYPIGAALLALAGRGGLPRSLVAMAVTLAVFFALALVRPGDLGLGDVKLSGLLGLYLGWFGWRSVVLGLSAGFVFAGVAGLVLLVLGRADRRTALAFGPFMLAGALAAVLV